jgi:hypothetical protein
LDILVIQWLLVRSLRISRKRNECPITFKKAMEMFKVKFIPVANYAPLHEDIMGEVEL